MKAQGIRMHRKAKNHCTIDINNQIEVDHCYFYKLQKLFSFNHCSFINHWHKMMRCIFNKWPKIYKTAYFQIIHQNNSTSVDPNTSAAIYSRL